MLPLEIRQEIYHYLGFPILGHWWAPCNVHESCSESEDWEATAHVTNHLYSESKALRKFVLEFTESRDTVFQWKVARLTKSHMKHLLSLSYAYGCRAIMYVNKFIYADIHTMIYHNTPVIFNFQLSNKAIHRRNWPHEDEHGFVVMSPSPWEFQFMTDIILTGNIGQGYEAEMPHGETVVRKWHRGRIVKLALSIRYIARHCLYLRRLTFKPLQIALKNAKLSALDAIPFALRELVRGCQRLQIVNIRHNERERFGSGDARASKAAFKPQSIPEYLREDAIAEWAREALLDIRKLDGTFTWRGYATTIKPFSKAKRRA